MLAFRNIQQYQNELIQQKVTCTEAVNYYLNNIEEKKHLNAFVEVYASEALQKAKILDDKRKNGGTLKSLHGVIIALKDVICYKGHKVTASSKILTGFTSIYSSTAVQRLLDEDAIATANNNCTD